MRLSEQIFKIQRHNSSQIHWIADENDKAGIAKDMNEYFDNTKGNKTMITELETAEMSSRFLSKIPGWALNLKVA